MIFTVDKYWVMNLKSSLKALSRSIHYIYDRYETLSLIFSGWINEVHGSQGNMLCSPVDTYPVVFLELLSSVRAALIPPLWSILRIKVKEPLSEGKLGRKTEGAEVEVRMRGKKSQRRKMLDGWWRKPAGHLSRWEQSRWFHRLFTEDLF